MEYLALGTAGLALAATAEVCAVLALLLREAWRPRGESRGNGGLEEGRTGGEERLMSAAEGFDNLMRYSAGTAKGEGSGFEHGTGGL